MERIPRIAKLMALAIRCDQLLRSGAVPDASTLARLAHVSQPRMTQILNLTLLAPDIQERLLCLDPVEEGKSEVNERMLRRMCAKVGWEQQRETVNGVTCTSGIHGPSSRHATDHESMERLG